MEGIAVRDTWVLVAREDHADIYCHGRLKHLRCVGPTFGFERKNEPAFRFSTEELPCECAAKGTFSLEPSTLAP